VARIAPLTQQYPSTPMYAPTPNPDHRPYRHPPSFAMMLPFAALPLAVLFAAAFPTAAAGLLVGVAVGMALSR